MADTDILYDVSQRIATVTLNRPDRLNAYTASLGDQLRAAMRRATDDPGVRVIILTGAGRGFCAGADMDNLAAGTASGGATLAAENPKALPPPFDPASSPDYQTVHSYFPAVPKPIIAAINGACAGLGLVYALYCDQRFAAAGAKFTTAFARRGLIAEHGISWMLPRLVGPTNALDLLCSARTVMTEEAATIGLVKALPGRDFLEAVQGIARSLTIDASPRSIGAIKRLVWDGFFQDLDQAWRQADEAMVRSFASEDFKEGVAHFIEKRAPRFTGR